MAIAERDVDFSELRARVLRGLRFGIGATAEAAASFIRESMPGPGASASDSKNRGIGQNDTYTPSNPGTPPGVRRGGSGQGLKASVNTQKISDFVWAVSTNSPYARIHEFGGTINHPGGTPYVITDKGAIFIKKETAARLESEGKHVGYTKPHTITMPARPFFGVTIDARSSELQDIFVRYFKKGFTKV